MTKKDFIEKIHRGLDDVVDTLREAGAHQFGDFDILNILAKIYGFRIELARNYRDISHEEASRLNERIKICDDSIHNYLNIQAWRNVSHYEISAGKKKKIKKVQKTKNKNLKYKGLNEDRI